MHPFCQGKLVRVINGAVLDLAIDLRKDSQNFGNWIIKEINSKINNQLWIPPGFGHGFKGDFDSVISYIKLQPIIQKIVKE